MTKYVKSIKFSTSGETYVIRDAEQKERLDTLEPQVAGKQDTLISGTNIKTINNQSILGSGNIEVGGGSGGTTDYDQLSNRPQIEGTTLTGNKSASDLGLATKAQGDKADTAVQPSAISDMETQTHASETYQVKGNYATTSELAAKQDKLTSANAGTNVTITEESGVVKINATGGSGGTSDYTDLTNKPQINGHELSGNKSAADLELLTSNDVFGSETIVEPSAGELLTPAADLTGTQAIDGGYGPYYYNDQTDLQDKTIYDFYIAFGQIDSEPLSVRIGHVSGCAGTVTVDAASDLLPYESKTQELFQIDATGLETNTLYTFKLDGTDPRVSNINQNYVGSDGFLHIPTDYVVGCGLWGRNTGHTGIAYKNDPSGVTTNQFLYTANNSTSFTQSHCWSLNYGFHALSSEEVTTYNFDELIKPEDTIQSDIISGLVDDVEELKAGSSKLEGKYLSIIGDSISTYQGWNNVDPIPGAAVYYPHGSIDNVNKTYWKKLVDRTGMNLLVNNSWSGSAVCYYKTSGDVANTPARTILHKDGHNPDIILINMGTNDFYRLGLNSQAGAGTLTMGTWNGRGEEYPDKTLQSVNFRQAYAVMLRRVIEDYPRAEVYCCTVPCGEERGGGLNEFNPEGDSLVEFNDAIREIATAYGVKVIELATTGINYASRTDYLVDSAVHPNEAGMERFYEVIRASLESKLTTTTSSFRTSAYVKSNQGSENNGKVLGIDSTGAVVPVTAGGGSVITPAGQASVFDDSEPVDLFGTHMEPGSEATEGDRVFADIILTGTLSAGAGKGPYWYKDQTALQNQKLYSFSVVFTRIDSQPLNVRIGQVSGSAGTITSTTAAALLPYSTNTQILFSVNASGLQEGVRYDFLLDGSDPRVININQNFVEDGYIKIPTDYVVGAGASADEDPNKEHTDIYYHRTDASDTNPGWTFTTNGTSMIDSSCTLNYCFHVAEFDDVEVYNFDSYLTANGEMHSNILSEFLTSSTVDVITDNNYSDIIIEDDNGNALVQFAEGHIKTKNFDSRNLSTPSIPFLDLSGKTVGFLGDSITYGVGASSNATRYSTVFCSIANCTERNLGVSGTCLAANTKNGKGDQRFLTRVTSANMNGLDLLIIFGGSNDFSYDIKPIGSHFEEETITGNTYRGTKKRVANSDNETFAGALHELILAIRAINPALPMVYLTPVSRGVYNLTEPRGTSYETNANGDYLSDFTDAIKDICAFYSIPVFHTVDHFPYDLAQDTKNAIITGLSTDAIHPNDRGHAILAQTLYKWIITNISI